MSKTKKKRKTRKVLPRLHESDVRPPEGHAPAQSEQVPGDRDARHRCSDRALIIVVCIAGAKLATAYLTLITQLLHHG